MRANTAGACINYPDCPSDSLHWEPIRDAINRLTGNSFTCIVCDTNWIEWFDTSLDFDERDLHGV